MARRGWCKEQAKPHADWGKGCGHAQAVFTVETKTWSKPVRDDAVLVFKGQTLKGASLGGLGFATPSL